VTEGGKLAGVICAIDLTAAVRDARVAAPISSVMTSPIITVDVQTPLGHATELLDRAHVTGLIVTEEGQPIGMFSQAEALASRDMARDTPVETAYDAAVMCLPAEMKIHRVAAHVADLRVRRVVVCRAREAIGIVSATDFARIVAQA
jgi:signal-transduction protein with cAMP-binding, CBS, and nucleotidyltransferase domain